MSKSTPQPPPPLTLLDGGMGRLLERNGVSLVGNIPGSQSRFVNVAMRVNVEQPELVVKSHKQFLQAGSRIITTNSYACVPNAIATAIAEAKGSFEIVDFEDTLKSSADTESTVSGTETPLFPSSRNLSSNAIGSNSFYQNPNNASSNSISSLASQKSTDSTLSFKDTTKKILPLTSYIEAAGKCAVQARREFRSIKRRNSSVENLKEKFSSSRSLARSSTVSELGAATANSQPIRIAGCIPPLGPSYKFEEVPEKGVLIRDYTLIANTIGTYSDLFLAETMSLIREALAVCEVLIDYNRKKIKNGGLAKPIFISFTLDDSLAKNDDNSEMYEFAVPRLRSKEKLDDAVLAVLDIFSKSNATDMLGAILVNCSSPDSVSKGIECLSGFFVNRKAEFFFEDFQHVQFGGYANAFEGLDPGMPDTKLKRVISGPGDTADGAPDLEFKHSRYFCAARNWRRSSGASIIGGCCCVFPEHIAELSQLLCEECDDE